MGGNNQTMVACCSMTIQLLIVFLDFKAWLSDLLAGSSMGKRLMMQRVNVLTEQSEIDGIALRTVKTDEKFTIELGGE